jgi:hypothetical protein
MRICIPAHISTPDNYREYHFLFIFNQPLYLKELSIKNHRIIRLIDG